MPPKTMNTRVVTSLTLHEHACVSRPRLQSYDLCPFMQHSKYLFKKGLKTREIKMIQTPTQS